MLHAPGAEKTSRKTGAPTSGSTAQTDIAHPYHGGQSAAGHVDGGSISGVRRAGLFLSGVCPRAKVSCFQQVSTSIEPLLWFASKADLHDLHFHQPITGPCQKAEQAADRRISQVVIACLRFFRLFSCPNVGEGVKRSTQRQERSPVLRRVSRCV